MIKKWIWHWFSVMHHRNERPKTWHLNFLFQRRNIYIIIIIILQTGRNLVLKKKNDNIPWGNIPEGENLACSIKNYTTLLIACGFNASNRIKPKVGFKFGCNAELLIYLGLKVTKKCKNLIILDFKENKMVMKKL